MDSQQSARDAKEPASATAVLVSIRLLGGFEVRASDGTVLSFATRKAEALVALLASRPGQSWNREKLCSLLWPEVRPAQARHSLRQTLVSVRKLLPPEGLKMRARALYLDPSRVEVDAAQLAANLAEGTVSALTRAAALYQGDLLEGIAAGEQPFEQWLTFERERLRSLTTNGLARLVVLHTEAGHLWAASEACAQLLRLDPLREEAHRDLMRLYARQGRRSAALQQYQSLTRALRTELGTEPEAETERLLHELAQATEDTPGPAAAEGADDGLAQQDLADGDAIPLIGRAAALAALEESYERAKKRRARVVLVLGEAGVGKTRLVEHFAADAEARGARVLHARCYESEQVLPFGLWSNFLRSAALHENAALLSELPARTRSELAQLLPEFSASSAPPAPTPHASSLFQALRWVLTWLGRNAPLVMLLDDLHWCDEMSLRALCFLSRPEKGAGPCLFVATVREEEVASSPQLGQAMLELERDRLLARVPLAPLSRPETERLSERGVGAQPLEPEWLERIWTISEGNPLVALESARALAEGAINQDVASLPVPERVRALILGRFTRASAPARELLCVAAVIGREIELDLLRRPGLEEAELVATLEELVAARFLRAEGERLHFAHDRIRETIHADMLPVRRRLLHDGVARALEQRRPEQLEELAGLLGYHHSKAGNAARAVPLLIGFSERAWRLHGVGEALAALDQALADSAHLPPAERLPTALGIVIRQAMCLSFLGRLDELIARLAAHEAGLLGLDQPSLSGPFYFWWGFAKTLLGESGQAQRHAERALAQASRCQDRRMIGYSHALLSYLCAVRGAFDQGVEHGLTGTGLLSPELELPEAVVIASLNLTLNYMLRGDWQAAMAASEQAHAVASAAESKRSQALAAASRASVFAYAEHWERALEECARAVEASQEPFTLVQALWVFGWAQTGSGRPELAVALLERALAELEQSGMYGFAGLGLIRLAEAQLAQQQAAQALLTANKALERARHDEDVLVLGSALRARGRAEVALARLELAQGSFSAARALFERHCAPIELAHTLCAQAELARVRGDDGSARPLLAEARALYAARGFERALERLDRYSASLPS